MIKKVLFTGMAAVAMVLTSCGDGMPKDMCDCIGVQVEMMKETADLDFDDPKMKDIETSYEAQIKICEELSKEYETKFEGMSPEEIEKEQKSIIDNCPAYKEMEVQMEAQMKKFEESMQNINLDEMGDEMGDEINDAMNQVEGEVEEMMDNMDVDTEETEDSAE